MRLRLLSLAEADLFTGFLFYESQAQGVGFAFLESLYGDIESLLHYYGTHRRVEGYHRLLTKRFPFAVYYEVRPDEIRIFRILDCRRDPSWLKKQLRRPRDGGFNSG